MNPEPASDKNWCSLKSALPWYFATAILAGIFGWLDSRAKHGWWFIGLETVLFIALATIAVLSLTAKRRRTIVNTQKILVFALCSLMLQLPANAAPPSEAQLQVIQFNRTPSPSATLAFSLQPSTLAQSAFQTNLQHLQHSSNSATAQDLHATLNTDSTNMTACEFVVGLVIVGTVAYFGMRILCRWLQNLTNAPKPPPPQPAQTNQWGLPTNNPDTNVTALFHLVPQMFEVDTNADSLTLGAVTNLSGLALFQLANNPPLTNDAGLPYAYYAVYTAQSSDDLACWNDAYSVQQWITAPQPDNTAYNYTAVSDPQGNLLWTQERTIPLDHPTTFIPQPRLYTNPPANAKFVRTVAR